MIRKIVLGGIGLLLLSPLAASADLVSDLQAQIQALLAQVAQLQAQQTTTPSIPLPTPPGDDYPSPTPVRSCPNLTVAMQRGSRDTTTGGQVTELQIWLADHFDLNEEDVVSGYFGKTTERYLTRFQQAQGIPAYGIVGSLTRATIARVCGGSKPTPGPIACPQIMPPLCVGGGTLVSRGTDTNGCSLGYSCTIPPQNTRIEISPRSQGVLATEVALGKSIPIAWSVWNAPANSQVQLWVKLLSSLQPISGVSGGDWNSKQLPVGNSDGGYEYATGPGLLEIPGIYEVTAYVVACEPQGCEWNNNANPTPGQPSRQSYAAATPFKITVLPVSNTNSVTITSPVANANVPPEQYLDVTFSGITTRRAYANVELYKKVGGVWVDAGFGWADTNSNPIEPGSFTRTARSFFSDRVTNPQRAGEEWGFKVQLYTYGCGGYDCVPPTNRLLAESQIVGVIIAANGQTTFPGVTMTVTPWPGETQGFNAQINVSQWTYYTYEIDWGEGDASQQTNRSRVVTVCNSSFTCSAPAGSYHRYAQEGLYQITLYAVKTTDAGEKIRTVVATASARAGVGGGAITVTAPNGGEQINHDQQMTITGKTSNVGSFSLALYKNDQWKGWITKDVSTDSSQNFPFTNSFTPSTLFQGLGEGDNAGAIWKIYAIGKKADGTGYVDDKSDAPFSFMTTAVEPRVYISVYYDNESTNENRTKINLITQGVKQCDILKGNRPGGSGSAGQFAQGEYTVLMSNVGAGGVFGSPESIIRIINPEPEMMIEARCLGENGVTYFSNSVTALKVFPNKDPIGYFDSTSADTFSGWACDYNSYSMPLDIHFYLDGPAGTGTFIGGGKAFENREKAVGDLCGNITEHGFKTAISSLSAAGQNALKDGNPHTVYAYAINVPSGNNPLLGTLPYTPAVTKPPTLKTPFIINFSASPKVLFPANPIPLLHSARLQWSALNVGPDGGCYIFTDANPGGSSITPSSNWGATGSFIVSPSATTAYTLACYASFKDGSPVAKKTITVTVQGTPAIPPALQETTEAGTVGSRSNLEQLASALQALNALLEMLRGTR